MGLASKLAAANQAPGAYPQGGQPQGGYPGQPQYQAYPGAGAPGQPPQQQYGAPPQQQYGAPPQQQYGAHPQPTQASPAEIAQYKQLLISCIQEKRLQPFYPPENMAVIDQLANRAPELINRLIQQWRVAKEVAMDVVKLALYDIVLYIDDSGSMQFEEQGSRITDLRLILERVSFAATLFDSDGISVRFMNTDIAHLRDNSGRSIQDAVVGGAQIDQIMSGVQFKGLTPMGTSLKNKVIDGIVLNRAAANQLRKPVLVITITDGQPAGEPQNAVFDAIKYAFSSFDQRFQRYGRGAIAFEFAQVGNDTAARAFLGKLDEEPNIGPFVDCTSNFENEQDEMSKANPPVDLTPDLWIIKLLLGAIDRSYDSKDEKTNHPAGGAPGGYGVPQQGYGQQQGYPGGPPPQGYPGHGQQGGYPGGPPPQGYPGQQQGYPGQQPQGYPGQQHGYQQQGYPGGPPPQGGKPPYQGQQQQYGGPPPPGRY